MSIYIETARKGFLKEKIYKAGEILKCCTLCPRKCLVDRLSGETGVCKTGTYAFVSSYSPHYGEEAPLVGRYGSGTIFFTHCNLMCNFCQNYEISHQGYGRAVNDAELADIMITLQNRGCHNINFVTPTHVIPQILSALEKSIEKGLSIPLVYNTGSYDCVESLKLLDGIIDIYMPDFKFINENISEITCDAKDYAEKAKPAILEMHKQVGDLIIDNEGIAERGLLIRHLVLPDDIANTRAIMKFITEEISTNTYINIMPQYRPYGSAYKIAGLDKCPTSTDFINALEIATNNGLHRGIQ
jgi:putative pyruvate formate lyase activating enzyme